MKKFAHSGLWRAKSRSAFRRRRLPTLELLEERQLLATVNWVSTSSGDWNVASNWSTHAVPGSGDDVVINVSGATPSITISAGTELVHSIAASDPLSITGGSLTVTSASTISGGLSMTGGTLEANGAGASLAVTGTTNVSNANLLAQGGAMLSLPDLTSYSEPGFAGSGTLEASGANSVLSLPALVSIATTGEVALTHVEAFTGGDVALPLLSELSGPVAVESENAGSKINLAMLDDFPGGSLTVTNQGSVSDPVLTTLSGVSVTLDGTGTLAISNWASVTSGAITVMSGTYSFAGLTDIDGSSVESEGGVNLSLPIVQSYTEPNFAGAGTLEASGANSVLSLPAARCRSPRRAKSR